MNIDYWVAPAININLYSSDIDDIIARIESVTKIPITTKGRQRLLCEGRQIAAYIMHVKYGMSLYSIGERLRLDHSTIAHSVKCVKTLLSFDKKFVTRWKNIIIYAEIDKDVDMIEPEPVQDESELPTKCEECSAYFIKKHYCELRMIRCYDEKPISSECKKYYLKKRV